MGDPEYEAIVLGTSMGGMQLLKRLLPPLPADYPLPLLVVQHLDDQSTGLLAQLLDQYCTVRVKEADEKERIRPGTVYIAPANYHLLVERDRSLSLSVEPRVNYARPSIDVLFETAADVYGAALVGVLLSGANCDGARGLRHIRDSGGLTVVQAPETAEAAVMPRAAIELAQPHEILSPGEIARLLGTLTGKGCPR